MNTNEIVNISRRPWLGSQLRDARSQLDSWEFFSDSCHSWFQSPLWWWV